MKTLQVSLTEDEFAELESALTSKASRVLRGDYGEDDPEEGFDRTAWVDDLEAIRAKLLDAWGGPVTERRLRCRKDPTHDTFCFKATLREFGTADKHGNHVETTESYDFEIFEYTCGECDSIADFVDVEEGSDDD